MKRWIIAGLAGLLLAAVASAHVGKVVHLMHEDDDWLFTCKFSDVTSATAVSTTTPVVTLEVERVTDGSPDAIITAGPTETGSDVTFRLAPVGRGGNDYGLSFDTTFDDSNVLVCHFYLRVLQ